jgi:hypothetical protein
MKDPDYPNIILSFNYRGFKIEIDRDEWQGQNIYAAWVNYDLERKQRKIYERSRLSEYYSFLQLSRL